MYGPEPRHPEAAPTGTVKPYRRHVLVCTGGRDWPPRIEHAPGALGRMARAARAHRKVEPEPPMLTAVDEPSHGPGFDVVVFPERRRFVDIDDRQAESILNGERPVDAGRVEAVGERIVLVCVHGARDARCGECGPPLLQKLRRAVVEAGLDDVRVWGSSHVGGHKYAGNVLIYPEGVWYGRVRPQDAERIVNDHLVGGRVVDGFLRGRMLST